MVGPPRPRRSYHTLQDGLRRTLTLISRKVQIASPVGTLTFAPLLNNVRLSTGELREHYLRSHGHGHFAGGALPMLAQSVGRRGKKDRGRTRSWHRFPLVELPEPRISTRASTRDAAVQMAMGTILPADAGSGPGPRHLAGHGRTLLELRSLEALRGTRREGPEFRKFVRGCPTGGNCETIVGALAA